MSSSPGCRVPQAAKEPRTTVDWRNIMNADELKKLTTESLDHLSAALAEGHSERLTALLKTMAQFHRYSFHNVCLLCRARHKRHWTAHESRLARDFGTKRFGSEG